MTMTHAIPTQLTDLEMFEALNLCFDREKYTSLIPEIVAEGDRKTIAERYSLTICTSEAEKSIRGAKCNEQS